MCNTWQFPSKRSEEVTPAIIDKIPSNQKRINLTGGEPALRGDLIDIVSVLDSKTNRLEISTNGYYTKRLVEVGRRYPHVTFRISLEGLPTTNDRQRGIKNGFSHAFESALRLREAGVKDVGFSMVVSDQNSHDLMQLYEMSAKLGFEFATATMHNSYYFHKFDNKILDLSEVTCHMEELIRSMLRSKRRDLKLKIKDWGRAYINFGILNYMRGQQRPLPCGAATDLFFVSPFGEILSCNGSGEPWVMGDLKKDSFEAIWNSEAAQKVREKVAACRRNCWMVGTAVPAMRRKPIQPIKWILTNKLKATLGKKLNLTDANC
jgi:MoaA/NifB/PqqE/SkfB family radical SAM enzyme